MTNQKRKLIEVAIPLEAINRAAAAEKSRKVGKPQQIHHWWARRPIVASRALLFAQLVDDPSSHPSEFPTDEEQAKERSRLFGLMENLVQWESLSNEAILQAAREEILACFDGNPPSILDPFAGGGSIPLEAQRLGLHAYASDLNPVAALINKALIEIPPRWVDRAPVFPTSSTRRLERESGITGLSDDVASYGKAVLEAARNELGAIYPRATLPHGGEADVVAWVWARTVKCPNPPCGVEMPLTRSWWLAKKKGKEAYILPRVENRRVEFVVGHDLTTAPARGNDGTVSRTGAVCVACGTAVPLSYVRTEGQADRLGGRLLAIVADGKPGRIYLNPTPEHERAASVQHPTDAPEIDIPYNPRYLTAPNYGINTHARLFTPRQLTAVITFCRLVREVHGRVMRDAVSAGMPMGEPLEMNGDGARAYADSVLVYLALAVSRLVDWSNALCGWESTGQVSQHLFTKQTISMVWDYSEAAVLGSSTGSFSACLKTMNRSLIQLQPRSPGVAQQADARSSIRSHPGAVICTDPPYYDNVPYADLSDVFYVWIREMLSEVYPSLTSTVVTPKAEELVAEPVRHGGNDAAAAYFEAGFKAVFQEARTTASDIAPMTVYYAFKQTEAAHEGTASTGWERLLEGLIAAGWAVTATWPVRTEMGSRMRGQGSNALASSIVLACRPRSDGAQTITRRGFIQALHEDLPKALRELQQGAIAPVDLAQSAIGPGMAIFTRYRTIVEADGTGMGVRTALALINQVLDEVLTEQEGDFDADTRFCVKWFSQFGWEEAAFGRADELSRSTNTSVDGLVRGGVFWARAGKARLLAPEELLDQWDPVTDERVSVWEVAVRLASALAEHGVADTARLMALAGRRVDLDAAKELAYLLYAVCEKRGWAQSALLFNGLGTSWLDLSNAARSGGASAEQSVLNFDEE